MGTTSHGVSAELKELASRCGILTEYLDASGVLRHASPAILHHVLRSLGVDISCERDVVAALPHARKRRWVEGAAGPVHVAWDGAAVLRIADLESGGADRYRYRIALEDGETLDGEGRLCDLAITEREEVSGRTWLRRQLPIPERLPSGYHEVEISVGSTRATSLLISAPRRAYWPDAPASPPETSPTRYWGLFAPLYALRTERHNQIANLGDLGSLREWSNSLGASTIATLPMLASFHDAPDDCSPYSPISRLFWNELYLDLEGIPEARQGNAGDATATGPAPADALIDYRAEVAAKRRILQGMARRLWARGGPRFAALKKYLDSNSRLGDYAAFRAATEQQGVTWPHWKSRMRDGILERTDFDRNAYRYHIYVQWLLSQQLAGLAKRGANDLGLYLDLPVGTHCAGYDIWRERRTFMRGVSVGAPPDALADGQNWGFPPIHPLGIRETRLRYFIDMVRNHCRYAGVLRLDHVMGLHRIFCIPEGATSREGVYVRYRHDELWAVLCLESHRNRTILIGEDLGTVPEAVRDAIAQHGALRMHVFPFEVRADEERAATSPPSTAVASLNTHDTATFSAFWEGCDIDARADQGLIDQGDSAEEHRQRAALVSAISTYLQRRGLLGPDASRAEALRGCLSFLAASDAPLVLVNLEDLWGEELPQNVPGTGSEQPNWRRRTRHTLEEICDDDRLVSTLREVDRHRRSPTAPSPATGGPLAVRHDVTGLSNDDLYLFGEGTHRDLHAKLGAHVMTVDGQPGVRFAVWAPNAREVCVAGDFNGWNRHSHPLVARQSSGIWEAFVPGVTSGDKYKYVIRSQHGGYEVEKADPMATHAETPPKTASIVWPLDYQWGDRDWMATRADKSARSAPISIYEVHLGSWRRDPTQGNRPLSYREIAPALAEHVNKLGFTHVELLPIMEHPFYGSWGYQGTGYFAPTSRYGTPQDFMWFVDTLHREGIGVILDWVPSHFPNDEHGLSYFDGTHVYEHADPRLGFHPDWHSCIFNYGRHEVRSFLISNALYWLDKYHVDGLRVDAVASMLYLDYSRAEDQWIPNRYGGRENLEAIEFLRRLNEAIYERFPDVQTYAEESTAWGGVSRPTFTGGLGFGYKWDMGWMHDTLQYFRRDPIHRSHHQGELTFRMVYAFTENYILSLSHDEVVHGKGSLLSKMPGDDWQKFANLRLLYGYMYTQPGKKLLFMGQELATWTEWNHETGLDWHLENEPWHAGMIRWLSDLNRTYVQEPALHGADNEPDGFEWIDYHDHQNAVLAYLRKAPSGEVILAVCNFTPVPRDGYRVGVPQPGEWTRLLCSDASEYAGSGMDVPESVCTDEIEAHGRPHSLSLSLPPLGLLVLKPSRSGS